MQYLLKLVRDKIPEVISNDGYECQYITIDNEYDFKRVLFNKLVEEVKELESDIFGYNPMGNLMEELVDTQEVLDTIRDLYNIDPDELKACQMLKRERRGSFNDRIFVTTMEKVKGD